MGVHETKRTRNLLFFYVINISILNRAALNGKISGLSRRGLHKIERQSTDFIEMCASLKSRKVSLYL
jgi:hypothetical protein